MSSPSPLTSPLLLANGFVHGFFTREGGCSSDAFASLNCSYGVGDAPENVANNLERICACLDLAVDRLVTVSQVHGSSVVEYGGDTDTNAFRRTEADAMVSRSTGHGLAIRTADCVPILIGCRATGQAAAVHAGWRGVVAEVLPKTIAHLLSRGSAPRTLLAAIGPHIGGSAFEVSEDIAQKLQASAPDCRAVARHYGPKPHVVLYSLVRAQLLHAGMTMDSIDSVEGCTYSDGKSFFSFRRDGKASGRQASVIRPREPGKNGPPNNK